jgi:hypothetical protein
VVFRLARLDLLFFILMIDPSHCVIVSNTRRF